MEELNLKEVDGKADFNRCRDCINYISEESVCTEHNEIEEEWHVACKDFAASIPTDEEHDNIQFYFSHFREHFCAKGHNQAAKSDAGKPKLTLVPRQILYDISKVREYGNNKYPEGGVDNWKQVEPERYRDAAFRHFCAYLDDPHGLDEESGLSHLSHLACNIAFLCEMEKGGN